MCITANYIVSFHFLSASKSLQIFVIISKSLSLVNLYLFQGKEALRARQLGVLFDTLSFGSHQGSIFFRISHLLKVIGVPPRLGISNSSPTGLVQWCSGQTIGPKKILLHIHLHCLCQLLSSLLNLTAHIKATNNYSRLKITIISHIITYHIWHINKIIWL